MPTKAQAYTAIDNAVVAVKAAIANELPANVNISDASISFGPTRWEVVLNAGGDVTEAENLVTSIKDYFEANSVPYKIARGGRRGIDFGSGVRIITQSHTYIILNFNYPR